MIDIYITHYVTEALVGYNDLAVDCVMNIDDISRDDGIEYQTIVLFWAETAQLEDDLRRRMPPGVVVQRCDGHVQPFLMNEATRFAKERGAELFICLHNDVRPSKRWLRNLVTDVRAAQEEYGRDNVVVTPRYTPYHWLTPHAAAYTDERFWARLRPEVEAKVLSVEAMRTWCKRHDFEFDGTHVVSPKKSYTTDDGHQLMMYCAAPAFFDEIGGCDESFTGLNFGDCDWGIRALQAGKKNLISQGCFLGHVSGVTFFNPSMELGDNHQRFIDKWDLPTFHELRDGSIWKRLHKAQKA
jgi:hypothetical protein